MEEENLYEFYMDRVTKADVPSKVLSEFYSRLFDVPITYKTVIIFGKVVKLYGRMAVFYALTSMVNMDEINHDNILPLLSYFSRQFFNDRGENLRNLTDIVKDIEIKKERVIKREFNLKESLDE